jgi:ribosomal-protein-alanine N-acetyltransferase
LRKNERFKNLPVLETKRLLLRSSDLSDAEDTFEFISDPEVTKYTFWRVHRSIADSEELLAWLMTENFASWSIVHKADEKVIGMCFLHSFNFHHRRAEMAFNLSRLYWKQGYATEAACVMIRFAFKRWRLNRIEGTCMLDNIASARVMEKLGMKFEGILRQHSFAKNRFHDLKLYSILRCEV